MASTPQHFTDIGGVLVPTDGYDFTNIAQQISDSVSNLFGGSASPSPSSGAGPVGLSATSYAQWQQAVTSARHTVVRLQGQLTESYSLNGQQQYAMAPTAVQNDPAGSGYTPEVTTPIHKLATVTSWASIPVPSTSTLKIIFAIVLAVVVVVFISRSLSSSSPAPRPALAK